MWIKKKRSKTTDCYLGPFYQNIRFAGKGDNALLSFLLFHAFSPVYFDRLSRLSQLLVCLGCSAGSSATAFSRERKQKEKTDIGHPADTAEKRA